MKIKLVVNMLKYTQVYIIFRKKKLFFLFLVIPLINLKLYWLMILNKRTKNKNSSYLLELNYI